MKTKMKTKLSLAVIFMTVCLTGCGSILRNSEGERLPVLVNEYKVDKPSATVLIAHGSDGVKPWHLEWANVIRSWGYNAVVIDHYTLRGIGMHIGTVLPGVRGEDRARDMIYAARWVQQQPWHKGKIAVIGFSQGGSGVLALANRNELEYYKAIKPNESMPISAAVAFYPGCSISYPPIKPSMPVQVHLAAEDTLAMIGFCGSMEDAQYNVHKYESATHSFDVYLGPYRPPFHHRYDAGITRIARENTKQFLDKNL